MTSKEQNKIKSQISFLAEIDKLKAIERKTSPIGLERRENSAEHSWQVIITAITLEEYSNSKIDLLKVIKMLAIHDIVEIDVGDTFHYLKDLKSELAEKERACAERVFSLLPPDQKELYLSLWVEFEERETVEAKFANAVDRLMAFILNYHNRGGTWLEYQLSLEKIIAKNKHIQDGSHEIWVYVEKLLEDAIDKSYINS